MRKWIIGVLAVLATYAALGIGTGAAHAACTGDCDGSGNVTVDEIVAMVKIALGNTPLSACPAGDADHSGDITVDEIITAVNNALSACPVEPTATPTATPTVTPTVTPPTPTPSFTDTVAPTATATATQVPTVGPPSLRVIAERNADGVATWLNQTVTTHGIVTVAAGLFANNKLKVFIQQDDAGVMVYDETAADVDAFQPGDDLLVTGTVIQSDPTSPNNAANGTIAIDISHGQWQVLSQNNPVPDPVVISGAQLVADGVSYTGRVIRVLHVHKTAGTWPLLDSKSTTVNISDDGGVSTFILRIQRPVISVALVDTLQQIGDSGAFTITGIAGQDDTDNNGTLLGGFDIWMRGVTDVVAEP